MIAVDFLYFPPSRSANLFRGALGSAFRAISADAYGRYFAPAASEGPSGLANPPRPFVLRTGGLDGRQIAAGESFHFGINLFDASTEAQGCFRRAVEQMFDGGLGAGRGRARLDSSSDPAALLRLCLEPRPFAVESVRVSFLTPTVLDSLEFAELFARLRDRISNLRRFYGDGPLPLDFRAMGERAAAVKLVSSDVKRVRAERTSRATGLTHSLGGFTGTAEYAGDLAEFLPFLEAGYWTGVGKQTVWGNGQIEPVVTSSGLPHPAPFS